jgi:5-formyltetrahydrofolate cyclo-ligase
MTDVLDLPAEKSALRKRARILRAQLDMPALSRVLIERLFDQPEFQQARNVLLYLATPDEVSVEQIALRGLDKRWYVPRCLPRRQLAVHEFHGAASVLRWGAYGIREPVPETPQACADQLDLVLVPALFYAEDGGRLGYGGGYFDRFLPSTPATCTRIGLIPDALVVETLPAEPWDERVDIVVTQTRVLRCARPARTP